MPTVSATRAAAPAAAPRRPLSLRAQFGLSLALLVFAASALLGGLLGSTSVEQLRSHIGQSLATDASRMAEQLDRVMAERARELALMSALDPIRTLPTSSTRLAEAQSMLDGLKRSDPSYVWIGVAEPSGRVLAATGGELVGTDISTRAAFRNTLSAQRGGLAPAAAAAASAPGGVGPPAESVPVHPIAPGRSAWVMDLVHLLTTPDGTVTGLLVAQLSWDWVGQLAHTILSTDSGAVQRQAIVVGAHDEVLFGPPANLGNRLSLPSVDRARAGFNSWSVETWPDHREYLTGAALARGSGPFPGPGSQEMRWTVLVREPVDAAYAPAYELRDTFLMAGGGLALLFALAGWLMAAWITRPMARIADAAERLRRGEDTELPHLYGAREIESLSASLRALVMTLTRKQRALDDMEQRTQRDPLTGLLNRVGLQSYLERATVNAKLSGISLLVLCGDLDGFKAVNDTFGHAAGDQLLRAVAQRMTGCVRGFDAVARVGGDEFVLVLEAAAGASDERALGITQRLLDSVQAPIELSGSKVSVGCSFGAALWPHDAETVGDIMQKADAALYEVKRTGKGRIKLFGVRSAA